MKNLTKLKNIAIGMILGATVVVSGMQVYAAISNNSIDTNSVAVQNEEENLQTNAATTQSNRSSMISYQRAKRIALNKIGGGVVTSIERDWKNGRYVYDVEITKGGREYDVRINARSGRVIFARLDRNDSDYITRNYNQNNINISYQRARNIALINVGGGVVTDIERDYAGGRYVYEVEVRKGYYEYSLVISARTGRVLSRTVEFDD